MPASFKHLTDRKVGYNSLLARWKDGLYYTAVLTKCDRANNRCRVCFEDGSEIWVSNRDLHLQISLDQLNEDEDIVCCICDDGNSEPPNEIILCDVCNQGYHQKCHQPPVDASKLDDSEETKDHKDWFCATCSYILNQTNRAKLSATVAAAQQRQPEPATSTSSKSTSSTGPTPSKQARQQTTRASASSPAASSQQKPQTTPKASQPTAVAEASTKATGQAATTTTPSLSPKSAITTTAAPIAAVAAGHQSPVVRQAPKVKQTPTISQQQQSNQKSTPSPIKPGIGHHQRSAPYYPLSSQVRAAGTASSTAALASMTASSALVVGSSAGRSKQDLVKQSNKSTQRQLNNESTICTNPDGSNLALPRHAVRKSCANFNPSPVKQSALPTATRSTPSLSSSAGSAAVGGQIIHREHHLGAQVLSTTSHSTVAKPIITMTMASSAPTVTPQTTNASYTITALTSQAKPTEIARTEPDTPRVAAAVALSLPAAPGTNTNAVVTINGQAKEPSAKSAMRNSDSSQQVSGHPLASGASVCASAGVGVSVHESNPKSTSIIQTKTSGELVGEAKQRSSNDAVSSSTNSLPQKIDSTQQASVVAVSNNASSSNNKANTTETSTSSTNNTATNSGSSKPTTVIVAGTLK